MTVSNISKAYEWGRGWVVYGKDYSIALASGVNRFFHCRRTIEQEIENGPSLNKRVQLAEKGKAPSYEMTRKIDCQHRKYGIFPTLRTVYVINDSRLFTPILGRLHRNGEYVESPFYEKVKKIVGRENMLTSPHSQHGRLRRPLEKLFMQGFIQSTYFVESVIEITMNMSPTIHGHTDFVAKVVIVEIIGVEVHEQDIPGFVDPDPDTRRKFIESFARLPIKEGRAWDLLQKCDDLTESERIDSVNMLMAAGLETTQRFIGFFAKALNQTDFRNKIFEEWKEFLIQRFPDKESAIRKLTRDQRSHYNYCLIFGIPITASFTMGSYKKEAALVAEQFKENTAQFLRESKWLEACFLEAARLFPIFPFISRHVKRDCDVGGMQFQAGDEIYVSPMVHQRDGRIWENPSKFDPSRFIGERPPKLFNFSTGQEGCIGRNLAKIESMAWILLETLRSEPEKREQSPLLYTHDFLGLELVEPKKKKEFFLDLQKKG